MFKIPDKIEYALPALKASEISEHFHSMSPTMLR